MKHVRIFCSLLFAAGLSAAHAQTGGSKPVPVTADNFVRAESDLYFGGVLKDSGGALPANDAWRFGAGAQHRASKTFEWGVAAEYAYGGTLDVNNQSAAPVALGGRGNLVGSFNDAATWFLSANFNWRF